LGPHVSSGSLINPYSEQETAFVRQNKEQKTEKRKKACRISIAGSRQSWFLDCFIITFMVQAFEIPSESMVKTLLVGDMFLSIDCHQRRRPGYVGPLIHHREIRHGDIIVFSPSERNREMYVVKRIIGIRETAFTCMMEGFTVMARN